MSIVNVPFIGSAYRARSQNASPQKAINCFLEAGADSAQNALYGTPGTVLRVTIGSGTIRGAIVSNSYAWFVSGNTVYRIASDYTTLNCGTILTGFGNVSIAANDTQIIIVDGRSGYIVETAFNSVTEISDPDFPRGVTQATYQDGYFIVAGNGTGSFFINQTPNVGTVWNALDYASAEGSTDPTVAIISDHRELWLIGSDSAEVWVNTGNVNFPFERSGNVFVEHGCGAPFTLDKLDNTVFWLGADSRGAGIVWKANGYVPQRISTHAVEYAIQSYSRVDDAFSFTYQMEGHAFYVLTFPTGNATWVFDVSTGEWHQRAWLEPGSESLDRWRPSCHVFFNGKHLVGDWENGNVYSLEMDVYTDNGNPIKRVRTAMTMSTNQLRQFFYKLQINMETGIGDLTTADPKLMLRYSNDSGHTWSNYQTCSLGAIGEYSKRAIFRRMGSGRNRVWEISMTDPVKFAVFSAVLELESGNA
jgi:hypothetical protein